ncbi:MAG: Ig-like domain-containing protein [Gemmatimonadaceae bacterium]
MTKSSTVLKRGTRWAAITLLVGVLAFACANPNQPPGGPPDTDAPRIVKISPSTGTIGTKPKAVVFQFDEVVSEAPKGAQSLAALVFISPRSGINEVDWGRSQIAIKPKDGFKANTVYTVMLSPGVMDLRNNSIDTATRIVFSTGGDIPPTKLQGVVFDWPAGFYAREALVEAISKDYLRQQDTSRGAPKDSVIYQTIADSLGRYSLEHFPAGNYVIRAVIDVNKNRLLDPGERYDTVSATVTAGYPNLDLYAFGHDSLGLKVNGVVAMDSNRVLKVTFDKPVHPTQSFPSTQFVLKKVSANRKDTTQLNIATIFTAPLKATFDSLRQKAVADSLAKSRPAVALDTSAKGKAARDSVARAKSRDSLAKIEQAKIDERRLLALRGGKPLPPKDTTPKPKMKRAALYTDVYVTPELPLEYETTYVLEVRPVRSVSGYAVQKLPYPFKTPPKPKPPEEKKTPGDTATAATVPIKR